MLAKSRVPHIFLYAGVSVTVLISGCSGALSPQKADYEKLPGSGDRMADGPGLIGSQKGDDYDGGYTLYSKDLSKESLVHPNQSTEQPSKPAEEANPSTSQQQNYEEFERYQQFQRMPEDSTEYQRFREWQEWKQYQQWRNRNSEQQ